MQISTICPEHYYPIYNIYLTLQNVPAAPRAALFPASNALTRVDEEYFAMIRAEAEWGDNSSNNNNNNNNTATAEVS